MTRRFQRGHDRGAAVVSTFPVGHPLGARAEVCARFNEIARKVGPVVSLRGRAYAARNRRCYRRWKEA